LNPSGKRALVTGGAGGIGREVVELLLELGATVGVLDQREPAAYRRGAVKFRPCDVGDHAQVAASVAALVEELQGVDILVNNAGMTEDSPLIRLAGGLVKHDVGVWERVIAANLSSVFYVTSNVCERMVKARTKGVIVNISSVSAGGNAGQTAYSAAKAGVVALTKTWARELNLLGIRVACVAPGFTKTGIIEKMGPKAIEGWNKRIPVRRMAEPSEIAEGILFVIKNDYFNGKVLELDGGLVM